MGERKVINKYYPPDFDPSKIKRRKMGKQVQQPVRLMAPFSMQCNKCGEYVYKGKKFNARKETAEGEEYYGIKVFRFYIKCPTCSSEITFKTDPKNADYICEQGATRNFENWNETKDPTGRTNALPGAEADDEYDSDGNLREEAKERDAMADLERAQEQSRREMEMMDELSDLRQRNARMEQSNVNADPTALLAALHAERETAEQEERRRREEAEDDAEVAKFFAKIALPGMPNGAANGKDKGKGKEKVKPEAADDAAVGDGTPATSPDDDDDENDEKSTALPGLTIKRRAAPGLGGPSEPSVASLLAAKGRVLDPVVGGGAANGSKPAGAPQQIKRKREGMQKLLGIKKKTKA